MLQIRILFWNLGGRTSPTALRGVVASSTPDVVVLAESPQDEVAILGVLNSSSVGTYSLTVNRSDRLQFFTAFSPSRFESMHDGGGVAVRRIDSILGDQLLLVALHLPSKLHLEGMDQAFLATRLAATVRQMEERAGHTRTIVIGDLNMNPFEAGVVASEGLHAVSSRAIVARGGRTVLGERRDFFYNPMWSLLGDDTPGPPGTYYYADSAPVAYFWHTYDQVLLRPALAANYQAGDVAILTSVGDSSLLTDRGLPHPAVADHLPVLATIRLLETVNGTT
jgi:hypothetical protein